MEEINELEFIKMHGAGNDFIIIDLNKYSSPTKNMCKALSNRHAGVGCDMILGVRLATNSTSVVSFKIWCPDGKESSQCGNGARCVALWAIREGIVKNSRFYIDSPSGTHSVEVLPFGDLRISMGTPKFNPTDIPLTGITDEQDIYELKLEGGNTISCGSISIGNPHAVIQVKDITTADVEILGKALQQSNIFPEQINVGFAQIISRNHIKLRVYEFGAGETLSCGSGACAAVAVLIKQGLLERNVKVTLPGGELHINWESLSSEIVLTGPATYSFKGNIPYDTLQ